MPGVEIKRIKTKSKDIIIMKKYKFLGSKQRFNDAIGPIIEEQT
jgi:hypothetical protein